MQTRTRFDYENNGRLSGDLERASWHIDQTAWSLCPLVPIPDHHTEQSIHRAALDTDTPDITAMERLTRSWLINGRHTLTGFDHPHATFATGVDSFIDSAVYRCSSVASLPLTYYHVPDVAQQIGRPHSHMPNAPQDALFIVELPTPQHDTTHVTEQMAMAKSTGHRVVVDMTFLPVATEKVHVDLSHADEIWVSANKAWNTGHLRPAWRFSREPVSDALTLAHSRTRYNPASLRAWHHIVTSYEYDTVVDQHLPTYNHICEVFDLTPTNNLLVARREDIVWEPMYTDNWNYNNLIGTHNLIHTHGKHFW